MYIRRIKVYNFHEKERGELHAFSAVRQ